MCDSNNTQCNQKAINQYYNSRFHILPHGEERGLKLFRGGSVIHVSEQ